MIKNRWTVFKQMMKVGMLMCIILAGFQVGDMWKNYKIDTPLGNLGSFITHQETERYSSLGGVPSPEFVEKTRLYNNVVRTIWFVLFFYVFFEICSYKEDKKGHWITLVTRKLPKVDMK